MRACVRACVRPSGFVRAITPTFMHEFQKIFWHSFCPRRGEMPFETFLDRLKVMVILEGHINWLVWAITPTFMH